MKLMPGSIPASDPPQVTAFTRLQKRRAPTPPPSLPLFIFLISICWSPVRSDAGAAHDATATAAVLKCKPEAVKLSGVGGGWGGWSALYLTPTSPEWLFAGLPVSTAGSIMEVMLRTGVH